MSTLSTLDRIAVVLDKLPATWPMQLAARHLLDGYQVHADALAEYIADGRVSAARGDELLGVYRGRLLAQLLRIERQLGTEGGAS